MVPTVKRIEEGGGERGGRVVVTDVEDIFVTARNVGRKRGDWGRCGY